jgi:outer membrane receptor protein involved in Fe transport
VQVTGPIQTTPSGRLDLNASSLDGLFPLPAEIVDNGGYYKSPTIPWQYTMNAAVYYEWSHYVITLSVYNLTNQQNWQPSPNLYGNDFLVLNDPRTYELRLQAKF